MFYLNRGLFQSILFFALCTAFFRADARVIETRFIDEVIPLIDEETWFLVDLDNCMFEATTALGHANWFYDLLEQRIKEGATKEEALFDLYPEWIRTQKVCQVKSLDEKFIPALLHLQEKAVVVIGLTHRQPSVIDSTVRQVESLGFNFSKTAPLNENRAIPVKLPAFYNQGIIFVGDYNKKIDIFKQFLLMTNKRPKKVVFIDDKRKNVEELESLKEDGIEYIGVHYTAINHVTSVFDRKIAEVQSDFSDRIISNEEALEFVKE